MSGYIGTQPVPQATQTRDSFTCTAGQTVFATGGYTPQFLDVYLNGIFLNNGTDYTASNGSDVILTVGASEDDTLEVVAYTAFEAANVTGATDFTVTGSFTSRGIDDNATSTAMTLDASGNLLVGRTAVISVAGTGQVGADIRPQGTVVSYRDGGISGYFGRNTSDGGILQFRKDGTTVGSIGVEGSNLNIDGGVNKVGLQFRGVEIRPRDDGVAVDGTVDLGSSTNRFKDLYLSGGVYLGGTGAANKLDDYEEGTWTPTLNAGFTVSAVNKAVYTKIGRQVTLQLDINFTGTGTTADLYMGGLPFTNSATGWSTGSGYFQFVNNNYYMHPTPLVRAAETNLVWQINVSTGAAELMNANNVDAGYMQVTVTYFTDA